MGQKVQHISPAELLEMTENELGPRFESGKVAGIKKFEHYKDTENKMSYANHIDPFAGENGGQAGGETKQRQYPGPRSKG